jgi:hypothetical protein
LGRYIVVSQPATLRRKRLSSFEAFMSYFTRFSLVAMISLVLGVAAWTIRADDPPVDDDPFPDTFMTMSVSYLNQAFLSIGILGDAYASEAYKDEQAGDLLQAHFDMALHVETKLKELAAAKGLDEEDRRTIERLVKIAGLVRTQVETLEEIWNGEESKVKTWNNLRDQTAKELTAFGGATAQEQPATTPTK